VGQAGVQIREGGLRLFNHPYDGLMCFTQHSFAPTERPDCKLVILTPAESRRFSVGAKLSAIARSPRFLEKS
jgi:hypothetical protein